MQKICPSCQNPFIPKKGQKTYCSRSCYLNSVNSSPDENGFKTCLSCKLSKPVKDFYSNQTKNKKRARCKECMPNLRLRNLRMHIKQRSRKKGVPFDSKFLTIRKFIELMTANDHCPCCGILFSSEGESKRSFDRIIPSLGYVNGNVVVICMLCNRIKADSNPGTLRKVADFIEKCLIGQEVVEKTQNWQISQK